jgi:thiol-disulfide isomerase/thioredoxin
MKRLLIAAAALAGTCMLVGMATLSSAHASDPLPFGRGSWAKLRTAHAGQPVVVHFWGITCGPCLVEMPRWGKLAAARKDLRLVLIAADPLPQRMEDVVTTLDRAGLAGTESWAFTDRFSERLRYEIDPTWAGELPRTELIDANGKISVLAGVADLDEVRTWLDRQKPSATNSGR